MIQVIETGNVIAIMDNGKRMFDIEFSYSFDGAHRNKAMRLVVEMVDSLNALNGRPLGS